MKDDIPCTLITDNMAASLMAKGRIQSAIVGADRVAANGDVANKIGTYGVAVLCRAHRIPLHVAAPISTIDPRIKNGSQIPIEEREDNEVTHLMGTRIAPKDVRVYNPAFDVTPARLVSAIVTEKGVLKSPYGAAIRSLPR
jgi:methylthioribose-1-phosphate isomerase